MNIHEHQAKEILKEYGAPVSNGVVIFSIDQIRQEIIKLKSKEFVLKAQIHAGGRGKAGGVKLVKNIEELEFVDEPKGYFSNRWLSCMLTPSAEIREGIRTSLEALNIETRPLWKPLHQQPIFKATPKYLNGVSDDLFEKGLCLPSGSNLTDDELNRVATAIKAYFRA